MTLQIGDHVHVMRHQQIWRQCLSEHEGIVAEIRSSDLAPYLVRFPTLTTGHTIVTEWADWYREDEMEPIPVPHEDG